MCERLVAMGFEKLEAQNYVDFQPVFPTFDEISVQPFGVILSSEPDLSQLDMIELASISFEKNSDDSVALKVDAGFIKISPEKLQQVATNQDNREKIAAQTIIYQARQNNKTIGKTAPKKLSPAELGEIFCLPQLCFDFDGNVDGVEKSR